MAAVFLPAGRVAKSNASDSRTVAARSLDLRPAARHRHDVIPAPRFSKEATSISIQGPKAVLYFPIPFRHAAPASSTCVRRCCNNASAELSGVAKLLRLRLRFKPPGLASSSPPSSSWTAALSEPDREEIPASPTGQGFTTNYSGKDSPACSSVKKGAGRTDAHHPGNSTKSRKTPSLLHHLLPSLLLGLILS